MQLDFRLGHETPVAARVEMELMGPGDEAAWRETKKVDLGPKRAWLCERPITVEAPGKQLGRIERSFTVLSVEQVHERLRGLASKRTELLGRHKSAAAKLKRLQDKVGALRAQVAA